MTHTRKKLTRECRAVRTILSLPFPDRREGNVSIQLGGAAARTTLNLQCETTETERSPQSASSRDATTGTVDHSGSGSQWTGCGGTGDEVEPDSTRLSHARKAPAPTRPKPASLPRGLGSASASGGESSLHPAGTASERRRTTSGGDERWGWARLGWRATGGIALSLPHCSQGKGKRRVAQSRTT